MESVWTDRLDLSTRRRVSDVSIGYTRFREGDLLLPKITPTFEAGRASLAIGLEGGLGAGTTEFHVLRVRPGMTVRFLNYVVNSSEFLQEGHADMYGVAGQKRISDDFVKDFPVPFPTLEEQLRITTFLDIEVGRIDDLILEQEAVNQALLRERFMADLIATLIQTSPPAGWQPTRIKFLFEPEWQGIWGDDPTGDDNDVICVRVADFDRLNFLAGPDALTLRSVPADQLASRLLRPGDVLLEKSGGTGDKPVGCAVNYVADAAAVCSNFIAVLRPEQFVDSRFVGLLLAAHYQARLNAPFVKQTTGIQNLDSHGYLGLHVHVPNKAEQREIARGLEASLDLLNRRLSEARHQVALLREHRQALISAAINGQIDLIRSGS
jgi:type I restriction enzyme S subunit